MVAESEPGRFNHLLSICDSELEREFLRAGRGTVGRISGTLIRALSRMLSANLISSTKAVSRFSLAARIMTGRISLRAIDQSAPRLKIWVGGSSSSVTQTISASRCCTRPTTWIHRCELAEWEKQPMALTTTACQSFRLESLPNAALSYHWNKTVVNRKLVAHAVIAMALASCWPSLSSPE